MNKKNAKDEQRKPSGLHITTAESGRSFVRVTKNKGQGRIVSRAELARGGATGRRAIGL